MAQSPQNYPENHVTETLRHQKQEMRLLLFDYAVNHTLNELLTKTLDEIELLTGSPISFYHFLLPDQEVLSLQAWSTQTKANFCQALGEGLHHKVSDAGVWADCVRRKKPVIHNDYAALGHKKGLPSGHVEVLRVLTAPVIRDDKVVAILGVGNKATDYIDQDVDVVSYLADVSWEIAEKKRADEALLESRESLRVTLNSIGDAVITTDTRGRITGMNPVAEELTGWPLAKVEGQPLEVVFKIVNAQTGQKAENPVQKALQTGYIVGLANHTKLIARNGAEYQIADSAAPIKDEVGNITGVVLVFRDVTEAYQMRETIRQSEERYRNLFNSIRDAILVADTNRQIVHCNPAFSDLFGYKAAEIVGQETSCIYRDWAEFKTMGQKIRRNMGNPNFLLTVSYKKKNGDIFPGETNVFYLRNSQGEIEGFIGMIRDITERRRAEEALIQAKERAEQNEHYLKTLIEKSPLPMVITDENQNIEFFNQKFTEMFGYTLDDVSTAEAWWQIAYPEEEYRIKVQNLWMSAIETALQNSTDIAMQEWELTIRDGSKRTCEFYMVPLGPKNLIMMQDITKRKRSEKRQKLLTERIEAGLRAGNLAWWEMELPSGNVTFDDRKTELLGYRPEQFKTYQDFTALLHPDDYDRAMQAMKDHLTGKRDTYEVEYRIKTAGGGYKWFRDIGRIVDRDSQTGCIRIIGIVDDITTRKQAEESLKASEEKFRSLFKNDAAVKLIIDPDTGRIVEANQAAEKFYGWPVSQLQQMRIHDINTLSPEQIKVELERVRARQYLQLEFRHRLADGSVRDVEVFGSRIDAKGKTLLHATVYDITDHRKLEEQLRQAQKMESIGRLAGGVAHDFNNMLSVILGYGEIVLQQLHPDDPMRRNVQRIIDAGNRSSALTRQLLAFSRKQTLQPEYLDLNALVRNFEKMLRQLIGEDIELELLLAGDLAGVMADPGQIEQVIMNLAVNARDAMPYGGKLTIETANIDLDNAYICAHTNVEPGPYVLLALTDTGSGMDKQTQVNLFEPFFTTKEKGTGLGLATVHGIVKQSGGYIWVYSEPGLGATFKIYLPQTQAQQTPQKRAAAADAPEVDGEHILVVEDEDAVRALLESMLTGLGYRVTPAANGGEALLLVEEKGLTPDLVITDVVMPQMSGKMLADRLRRTHPNLKVLFMSGYTDNAIVHHGVLDANTPFIQKPFRIKDIAAKVQALLRAER